MRDTQKPYFLRPATPPALCITALLSNPLVSSHCIRKETRLSDSRVESHTSPCAPSPPPGQPPLTPQQGGLLPLPAQMRPLSKGLLHHLTQQHHWFTFPFSRICHFLNYSFHAISFSFISLHQREAPGNQGVLLDVFAQHLQSPQGRYSEKP